MAGCCEPGDEPLGCIKFRRFSEWRRNDQCLMGAAFSTKFSAGKARSAAAVSGWIAADWIPTRFPTWTDARVIALHGAM